MYTKMFFQLYFKVLVFREDSWENKNMGVWNG